MARKLFGDGPTVAPAPAATSAQPAPAPAPEAPAPSASVPATTSAQPLAALPTLADLYGTRTSALDDGATAPPPAGPLLPRLTVLSSRGENGADRSAVMTAMRLGEGHPVWDCGEGTFYDAKRTALVVLSSFTFWGKVGNAQAKYALYDLTLDARTDGAAFTAGYRSFAVMLSLALPLDGYSLGDEAPVLVGVSTLYRQHCRILRDMLAGVELAQTPDWLGRNPGLHQLPPLFRVIGLLQHSVKPTKSGQTMCETAAVVQPITPALATALDAANGSRDWLARFAEAREAYTARVEGVKKAIADKTAWS